MKNGDGFLFEHVSWFLQNRDDELAKTWDDSKVYVIYLCSA